MIIELHEIVVENGVRKPDVPVLRNSTHISAVGLKPLNYTASGLKVNACYVTTGAGLHATTIYVSESYREIRGMISNAEMVELNFTQL